MNLPRAPHAILAHYVHRDGDPHPAQGSVALSTFARHFDAYGDRLISASEWIKRALADELEDAVAVTFDDGLREALLVVPLLHERGITAAFNVYTGPLVGVPNFLERARWIRNYAFGGVEAFYAEWETWYGQHADAMPSDYLADRRYLTRSDRRFRFTRNEVMTPDEYEVAMTRLVAGHAIPEGAFWLRADELRALHSIGHVIGLHTHSHPTVMAGLSREQIALEYATSRFVLATTLGVEPSEINTGSHPCGHVTEDGLDWLRAAGMHLMWAATLDGASLPMHAPRWSTGYWT